jgi:hypothetical protein
MKPGVQAGREGGVMRYLCLLHYDYDYGAASGQALRDNSHCIAAAALQPVAAAVTVRVRDGRALVTDGPFAQTPEPLGGFCLIDARDLNEAIQVAVRLPGVPRGGVEVRPVRGPAWPA